MMNTPQKIKIFYFFMILILFFILIFILLKLIISDNRCTQNPLIFGINELKKLNKSNLTCTCVFLDKNIYPFSFNDQGIYS